MAGCPSWRYAGCWRDPLGRFDPQALLCTDPDSAPERILRRFVQRRQLEVTFQEIRARLGVETQRRWSDQAIARTAPCLLGPFSVVALLAARLSPAECLAVASSAWWYRKRRPTFGDTLAAVRLHFWREQGLLTSRRAGEAAKPQPALQNALVYAVRHAA